MYCCANLHSNKAHVALLPDNPWKSTLYNINNTPLVMCNNDIVHYRLSHDRLFIISW